MKRAQSFLGKVPSPPADLNGSQITAEFDRFHNVDQTKF